MPVSEMAFGVPPYKVDNEMAFFAPKKKLLLDAFPNAAFAYSLRKLRSAYNGPAVRVRRGSDNVEQDILFTNEGVIDEVALLRFIGSSSGFVVTWYDQSGSGRNSPTQGTAANQPTIVASGGILGRRSGKTTIIFDGTNDFLMAASSSGLTISPTSFITVSSRGNSSTAYRTVFSTGILAVQIGFGALYSDSNNLYMQSRYSTATAGSCGNYINTLNTNSLLFALTTNTGETTFYNGSNIATRIFTDANNTTATNISIGARLNTASGSPSLYLNGSVSEIVAWQSNQLPNRTLIEQNINSYYPIY